MYSFQFPEMLIQCSDSICFVITVLKISNNFSCLHSHLGTLFHIYLQKDMGLYYMKHKLEHKTTKTL